jgi:hypothetical protein
VLPPSAYCFIPPPMPLYYDHQPKGIVTSYIYYAITSAFFSGGRRGMRTPKHFVNLMAESKNFKTLEFLLNQLQT